MDEIDEKIKILSNIPDEILSNDKCKLLDSRIILPRDSWIVYRDLNYYQIINRARISVRLVYPIDNTYKVGITVYIYGASYDYDKVPKKYMVCPHVDIAYKIAAYLKLIGLRLL